MGGPKPTYSEAEMRRLRAEGMTQAQIARQLGCSPATVQHRIGNRNGWIASDKRRADRYRERKSVLIKSQGWHCPCGLPLTFRHAVIHHDHRCCDKSNPYNTCGACDVAAMHGNCNTALGMVVSSGQLKRLGEFKQAAEEVCGV